MLDRWVTLKVVSPDLLAREGLREAFLREAKAMARVHHANVVEIFELAQSEAGVYFAMQFIDGIHLRRWIENHPGPCSVDDALAILEPLCKGVQAIHDAGTSHRGLNPTNVMLGPSFRVAVSDLGTAVFDEALRAHSRIAGVTPEYMAPEIAAGYVTAADMVSRIDIYALACIAYELLVGHPPFQDADPLEVINAQASRAPTRPTLANPELADEFDEPLMRALEKSPQQRTASAEQFRRELLGARDAAAERLDWTMQPFDVLIVDDDPDMLDWLELQLAVRFPGANMRRAENGLEAMELIDIALPDLIITDLDMPGLDGHGLTRHLRNLPDGEEVPLIVVTAVGGAPDWARLQALGASGFQLKPIDPDSLAALVRKQLGERTV
jgi:serine/threonine-protein kinase